MFRYHQQKDIIAGLKDRIIEAEQELKEMEELP
jgi:hypothetical protein